MPKKRRAAIVRHLIKYRYFAADQVIDAELTQANKANQTIASQGGI